MVEVYDAYYAQSEQYRFVHDNLSSLLETPGEQMMVTEYSAEDSGGKPFNNRRVTDSNSPATEPVEVAKSTGKADWSESGPAPSALRAPSRLACGEPPVHEATGGHGCGTTSTPTGGLSHRNDFDVEKIARLSDEELMRMS